MAKWHETRSAGKACRIDLEQVVAVVAKKKGHVEVFLRGAHSLTFENLHHRPALLHARF